MSVFPVARRNDAMDGWGLSVTNRGTHAGYDCGVYVGGTNGPKVNIIVTRITCALSTRFYKYETHTTSGMIAYERFIGWPNDTGFWCDSGADFWTGYNFPGESYATCYTSASPVTRDWREFFALAKEARKTKSGGDAIFDWLIDNGTWFQRTLLTDADVVYGKTKADWSRWFYDNREKP